MVLHMTSLIREEATRLLDTPDCGLTVGERESLFQLGEAISLKASAAVS